MLPIWITISKFKQKLETIQKLEPHEIRISLLSEVLAICAKDGVFPKKYDREVSIASETLIVNFCDFVAGFGSFWEIRDTTTF